MMGRIKSKSFRNRANRFVRDDSGATAIEYGLIVSLIFLAITAAVRGYTNETKNLYSKIESSLEN